MYIPDDSIVMDVFAEENCSPVHLTRMVILSMMVCFHDACLSVCLATLLKT